MKQHGARVSNILFERRWANVVGVGYESGLKAALDGSSSAPRATELTLKNQVLFFWCTLKEVSNFFFLVVSSERKHGGGPLSMCICVNNCAHANQDLKQKLSHCEVSILCRWKPHWSLI